MKIEPFSIYWADVPYEDIPESKVRPVIILEDSVILVNILPITSNTSRPENYVLKYWKEAGLKKPSAVQLQYVVEIETDRIGKRKKIYNSIEQNMFQTLVGYVSCHYPPSKYRYIFYSLILPSA